MSSVGHVHSCTACGYDAYVQLDGGLSRQLLAATKLGVPKETTKHFVKHDAELCSDRSWQAPFCYGCRPSWVERRLILDYPPKLWNLPWAPNTRGGYACDSLRVWFDTVGVVVSCNICTVGDVFAALCMVCRSTTEMRKGRCNFCGETVQTRMGYPFCDRCAVKVLCACNPCSNLSGSHISSRIWWQAARLREAKGIPIPASIPNPFM